MRRTGTDNLPVTSEGALVGEVSQKLIAEHVKHNLSDPLLSSVSEIMTPPGFTASPAENPVELLSRIMQLDPLPILSAAPIVDADGYCHGVVYVSELLSPDLSYRPKPSRIGGMATPFGVYLTDGAIQAGVSNIALAASGAMMAIIMLIGAFASQEGLTILARHLQPPWNTTVFLDPGKAAGHPLVLTAILALEALAALPFLLLMRFSILAGYHAAEHQTVHAIERNEPLLPEIVSRMPRVHPRCGTNLLAAVFLFSCFWQLMNSIPMLQGIALIPTALLTLALWRKFGNFLQDRFTTRTPTKRQISAGIFAGQQLLEKFVESQPARNSLLRRIWCIGLLQSLAGMAIVIALLSLIPAFRAMLLG